MRTLALKDFREDGPDAYLWEETGRGSLARIKYVTADCWAKTEYMSWCCCWDTPIYIFDSKQELDKIERDMRGQLTDRRFAWGW